MTDNFARAQRAWDSQDSPDEPTDIEDRRSKVYSNDDADHPRRRAGEERRQAQDESEVCPQRRFNDLQRIRSIPVVPQQTDWQQVFAGINESFAKFVKEPEVKGKTLAQGPEASGGDSERL